MEIPQQNRAENFASYVLRVCNTIDSVRIPLNSEANSFRESERDKDARVEKVNGKNNYKSTVLAIKLCLAWKEFTLRHIKVWSKLEKRLDAENCGIFRWRCLLTRTGGSGKAERFPSDIFV